MGTFRSWITKTRQGRGKFFFSNYRPIITKNKYEKSTKKFRRKEEDIYNSKYFINSR